MSLDSITVGVRNTAYFLGICPSCNMPSRQEQPDVRGYEARLTCPEDGTRFTGKRLAAVTTTDVCDPRCMGAVGPSCECACGGENHGGSWSTVGRTRTHEEFADAVAKRQAHLAKVEENRRKRAAAKAAETRKANEAWRAANADVVTFLANTDNFGDFDFLWEMSATLDREGTLTERQTAAVRRCAERHAKWAAKREQEEKARAAKLAKGKPMPTGRVEITGTVVSTKWVEDDYSYHGGSILKMLVETADGWRVYGTVPSDLKPSSFNGEDAAKGFGLKGATVTFTATIKPKEDAFGIFSRPTRARVLATA